MVEGAEVIHLKVRLMTPLIHVLPLQRRTGQNSYQLLATQSLQHTRMTSVNMRTHTQTEAHTAVVHTDTLWGHLVCQLSIWPKVVIELKAVACIFVAGSYLMEVIGRILQAAETEREAGRER